MNKWEHRKKIQPIKSLKSIKSIQKRLSSHSMFANEDRQNLILMCEDCRVEAQFSQNDKFMDIGERPKPRTTDDYK